VSERARFSMNFYELFVNYLGFEATKNSGLNFSKNHPQNQVNFMVERSILMTMLVSLMCIYTRIYRKEVTNIHKRFISSSLHIQKLQEIFIN